MKKVIILTCFLAFIPNFAQNSVEEENGEYYIKQDENYNIVLSSISTGFLHDLCWFLDDFQDGKIPAYLIEAEQVGIGSYGEPVVKNIKIIVATHKKYKMC